MTTLMRSRRLLQLPPLGWLSLSEPSMRIEEFRDANEYVVRAELPGVDPSTDVHVWVADSSLRIQVERVEEHMDKERSEFRYGELYRSVPLPLTARPDTARARYDKGILEVRVTVGESPEGGREIPVAVGAGHDTVSGVDAALSGQAVPTATKAAKKA